MGAVRKSAAAKTQGGGADAPRVPLARLLALAYRQIIDDLHSRLAARGYADVPPNFGYVLLAVRDQSMTVTAVAPLLAVSKQAASKLIDAMDEGGYVTRAEHGDDARSKAIVITSQGKRFLSTVESIYVEIEGEWANLTSKQRVESLRSDLRTIIESTHQGRLPVIRPTR